MQSIKNSQPSTVKITLACLVHGDEKFSGIVFDYFRENLNKYPGLKLILANEEAYEKNVRFIDEDLNRAFPGDLNGNKEQRLAFEITKEIGQEDFLIDVHTSISNLTMTPILTSLNKATKRVINALDLDRAVFVKAPLADKSLIGQIKHGVSLEINRGRAEKPQALQQVIDLVEKLRVGQQNTPREREVYTVSGVISKDVAIPADAANFKYIPELDCYPFLYHPNSYEMIHALKATFLDKTLI